MMLLIMSPSPTPVWFLFFVSSSLPKGLKSLAMSSGVIPEPVSHTSISTSFCSTRAAAIQISPFSVNLIELLIKFKMIYEIRCRSDLINFGVIGFTISFRMMFLPLAAKVI